jgi:hypothetical protein
MPNKTSLIYLCFGLVVGAVISFLILTKPWSISKSELELAESKGRVQIYEKQIATSDSIQKELKKRIFSDSLLISRTKNNIKIVEKWYAVEKTRVSKLPTDSAVSYIKKRLNRK